MARLALATRMHLVRSHGVLAPAAKWRAGDGASAGRAGAQPRAAIVWADLLRRVFALELLVCHCGGRRGVLAKSDEGPVARRVFAHLGLPAEPTRLAPVWVVQGSL